MAGSIVVEVKHYRASARPALRQLERYAEYAEVDEIILATNRAMALPARVGGKPLTVISLGRTWL